MLDLSGPWHSQLFGQHYGEAHYSLHDLEYLPLDLVGKTVACQACGASLAIPWTTQRVHNDPVMPLDFDPIHNKKMWVQISEGIPCSACGETVMIHFPRMGVKGKLLLFGDEAYRDSIPPGTFIWTYTLVGASPVVIKKTNQAVRELKIRLCPSLMPEQWRFHMVDLVNKPQGHPVFAHWAMNKRVAAVQALGELMLELNNELFVFNLSATHQLGVRTLEAARAFSFVHLIMKLIDENTSMGLQPNFVFDQDDSFKTASRFYLENRNTFQFAFLSRCITIPDPQFVQPGSQPCLELADFVSYVIARFHSRTWQKKNIDINPACFGKAFYFGFVNDQMIRIFQQGYPWSQFYGEEQQEPPAIV